MLCTALRFERVKLKFVTMQKSYFVFPYGRQNVRSLTLDKMTNLLKWRASNN